MINQPIFCLTSSIGWASPFCTQDLLDLLKSFDVTPTLFATHDCAVVKAFNKTHPDDVGVHPNFRANSSHGKDEASVIDHVFTMYPNAKAFRGHGYADSSEILHAMARRGVKYDSNLCLYLQPNVVPLQLGVSGITRFPVFWEDDVHWLQTGGDWDFQKTAEAFMSPGLKILNVHPFVIATNACSADYYASVKKHIPTLTQQDVDAVRHKGPGARTFLIELLKFFKSQGMRFHTLNELYRLFPAKSFLASGDETKGRATEHSDADHKRYWSMSDDEKQRFLREEYQQRNPTDVYATSRDFNVRELEIKAISEGMVNQGDVLDLGCGNGYTLISLAKRFKGCRMVGVDFSDNLIAGAKTLVEKEKASLPNPPEFICADAIKHIKGLNDNSVDCVITERFLQNMPTVKVQNEVMQQIHRILKKGGRFLMCEASEDGFNNLNDIRAKVGLSIIPATSADNVSAIRIMDQEFEKYAESEIGFKLVKKLGFSNYMIVSRVLQPLMIQPMNPRFDSNYNKFARLIQEHTQFTPGFGSNVLWVLEK